MKSKSETLFLLLTLLTSTSTAQTDTLFSDNNMGIGIGNIINKQKEGKWVFYYSPGIIESEGVFHEDKKNGEWKWYYKNGQLMSTEKYESGIYKEGNFWDSVGNPTTINNILTHPSYPLGGEMGFRNFLAENIKYPRKARNNLIQGTVIVDFVVSSIGNLEDIKINTSVNELLDKEAIRVIKKSSPWIPGTFHGKTVRVAMRIPVYFVLKN